MQNLYFDEQKTEQNNLTPLPGFLESLRLLDKIPLAVGFGCLLGLSSPGFNIWWLAWVGLAPLMVLLRSCKKKSDAALIGLTFGMGYELVVLSWLLGLFPLRWIGMQDWIGLQAVAIVWFLQSFHESLLFGAFALLTFALPMRLGFIPATTRPFFPYLLCVPLIWIFFQWVIGSSEIFLGVPVNQLVYSQYQQLFLIQIAKFGGSQLLEFIMVLCNLVVAALIMELSQWVNRMPERVGNLNAVSGAIVDLSAVAATLVIIIFWGQAEVTKIASQINLCSVVAKQPSVPIAIIQGNISIEDERLHSLSPQEICQRYIALSNFVGVPLLIYPEGIINNSQLGAGLLMDKIKEIVQKQNKQALVGTIAQNKGGLLNAACLLSANSQQQTLYVKRRLVPFGEFFPHNFISEFIPGFIKEMMVSSNEGFIPSTQLELLSCTFGKIGTSICVEVIYPKLIADEVRKGAALLVNISNLAWFHNSMLNRQILAAACLRAVENGRYLILSTNTGISAVIDPSGVISSLSIPGRHGVLVDTVQFLCRKTPFTKMWWL